MERKLLERMIGAGVLVLVLVVAAPLILDGEADIEDAGEIPGQRSDEVRSHVFRLDGTDPAAVAASATPPPVDEVPAAEPVVPSSAPTASPAVEAPAVPPAAIPPPVSRQEPEARPVAPQPAPAQVASSTPVPPPDARAERPAVAVVPEGNWLVQVGTFGQKANAERLASTLRAKGFEASVSQTARGGSSLYRVRVGPAGDRAAADGLRARLASAGQSGQVVRR